MDAPFETIFMRRTIEKTPFTDTPAQNFFAAWCESNDSIVPQFMPREEWNKRGILRILEKNDQGKQTLFLPKDLHLWEMMDVIRTVDHDTLARNPEKRGERADKIQELGKTFEKAGLYLSQYLPILEDNRENKIAKDVTLEFYQYGLSLQHKEKKGDQIPGSAELSQEDITKLDEWFLGRDAYQKRLARLGEEPTEEQINLRRRKLLSVYFQALAREGYRADDEKPWKERVGPMHHLQDRTRRQITKAIETPEREMKTSIFRRGVEKLVTEMKTLYWKNAIQAFLKDGISFDLATEKIKLANTLEIPKLKKELAEIKNNANVAQISAKELEIAKKIQQAVSGFAYQPDAYKPSKMIETQFINCVGSSILGEGLLDEIGIKYLHADLPIHSASVLITSDGKVYWQDFTPGIPITSYTEISADMIEEEVDLSNVPESGISLQFKKWNPYPHVNGQLRVNLFNPEIGLQLHILNNMGYTLNGLGKYEEAIAAYRQAISVDPKDAAPYYGLGHALSGLGKYEEAIAAYRQAISVDPKDAVSYCGLGRALNGLDRQEEAIAAYRQAISVDPKDAAPYYGLGHALSGLGKYEEAIAAYRQAISIDPKDAVPYYGLGYALNCLGKYEEAIAAYQKFIELSQGDEYWINRAKEIIKILQK